MRHVVCTWFARGFQKNARAVNPVTEGITSVFEIFRTWFTWFFLLIGNSALVRREPVKKKRYGIFRVFHVRSAQTRMNTDSQLTWFDSVPRENHVECVLSRNRSVIVETSPLFLQEAAD